MQYTKIMSFACKPTNATVFKPYLYGQVGTKAVAKIVFVTTTLAPSIIFQWGFAKNSVDPFVPLSFEVDPQHLRCLNTGQQQAYLGNVDGFNFMSPISGEDGDLKMAVEVLSLPSWGSNEAYSQGDTIEWLGVDYISLQDNNKRKRPNISPEWWSSIYSFNLAHEFIIQPYSDSDNFNDSIYKNSEYLKNTESVKYLYQIDVKEILETGVIQSSSSEFDPLIENGSVGFLGEKLNGNVRDTTLTNLSINANLTAITGDRVNNIAFDLQSDVNPLTLATSHVQVIAYILNRDLNTNVKYLEQILFSSASRGETDNMISNVQITENSNILSVNFDIKPPESEELLVYVNVMSDVSKLTDQSFLIYANVVAEYVAPSSFIFAPIYGLEQPDFAFYHEYLSIDTQNVHQNVAGFVDDNIISKAVIQQVNDFAVFKSISISLINNDSEVLENVVYNKNQLPVYESTSYQINDIYRQYIDVTFFPISKIFQVIYPFKIKESWTSKIDIRLVVSMFYEIGRADGVDVMKSAPFRLGGYNQTKNTNDEPQILAKYSDKIKVFSEDGSLEINQLNLGGNSRLIAEFEDKNTLTNSLQATENELTGYYGVSLPNSPDNLYYITKQFGALGVTFYRPVDDSLNPICKITKVNDQTAKVEAVVDVDNMLEIVGESDNYNIVCRLDKYIQTPKSLKQYTFIFHQFSDFSQKYEYVLDGDLLKGAFTSVYYSVNYPNVLRFTHVTSAYYSDNFEEFKNWINANGNSGDIITIEWTSFSGSITESIVKISIPSLDALPSTHANIYNNINSNYVEHENLYAFDDKIEFSSCEVSGTNDDEKFYAIRGIDDELVEFKPYSISNINADIQATTTPFVLHLWGARDGGNNSFEINYFINESTKLLKFSTVYGQSLEILRSTWNQNSWILKNNQYAVVGDAITPYNQLEVRDNFTFSFVFWNDTLTSNRQQLLTTNSRDYENPNPLMSFNITRKTFNLMFVAVDGAVIKILNYSGLGIKAGYNYIVGRWDATNENNRHVFINGLLQKGVIENTNDFDINTDTVINSYNEAMVGANDFDTSPSEYFNGKMFEIQLNSEAFTEIKRNYREGFLKGIMPFNHNTQILNGEFSGENGSLPSFEGGTGVIYPIVTNNTTTYVSFNSLF